MDGRFWAWASLVLLGAALANEYRAGSCPRCGVGVTLLRLLRTRLCPACEEGLSLLAGTLGQR